MPTPRDLQFGSSFASQNFQEPETVTNQTPAQKFSGLLADLLRRHQQLGTRPFAEQSISGQEEQVRRTEQTPANLIGASPTIQSGVRAAQVGAVQPTVSGAETGQKTFGEQIKSFGDVIQNTRQFLVDEESRQQQLKENMRQNIIDAATLGGSAGLDSLLKTKEGQQAFKIAGFDSETLIASVKSREVEEKRRFDVEQSTSTATLKALQDAQEKATQAQKVVSEGADIINITRGLLSSDLGGITGKERLRGFLPGTASREQKAKATQLRDKLSLGEREKLKGQGTITDFEGKMLGNAATALTFDLSEEAYKRELTKIMGVFQTAAGGTAGVRVTSPDGKAKEGQLSRNQINDAILSGFQVEYTGQ